MSAGAPGVPRPGDAVRAAEALRSGATLQQLQLLLTWNPGLPIPRAWGLPALLGDPVSMPAARRQPCGPLLSQATL